MKKLLAVVAVLSLGFAYSGCDFGGDGDEDATPELTATDEGGEPDLVEDVGKTGDCVAGESAGYKFVMVQDVLENPTLETCGGGNPGADIDSICVYRDDASIGCAADVVFFDWAEATCDNDKDVPEEVLDIPDGVACSGDFTGYFSLNGGHIIVSFAPTVELLCGDVAHIIEMRNCDNPEETTESYTVSYGAGDDCLEEGGGSTCTWSEESDSALGEAEIDVNWVW